MDHESQTIPAAQAASPQSRSTANQAPSPKLGTHVLALDGVRGIAISLVLIYHLMNSMIYEFKIPAIISGLTRITRWGWSGVDLFFVLSGFLITGILVDSKGKQNYFRNFYVRRTLRIFPLYYGVLLAATLVIAVSPQLKSSFGSETILWQWLYATNIVIVLGGWGSFGILTHFWSLAVEEHFYLIWPFIVSRLNVRSLIMLSSAICVLCFLGRLVLVFNQYSDSAPYVLTPLRMDSLVFGGLIAILIRSGANGFDWRKLLFSAGKVAALLFGVMVLLRHRMIKGGETHADLWIATIGFTLLAIISGALVLSAVQAPAGSWRHRIFTQPLLVWLGKYAYGLYVFHPPIFVFFFHTPAGRQWRISRLLPAIAPQGALDAAATVLAACLVTVGITMLSWNLWEKQFLKLKVRFQ